MARAPSSSPPNSLTSGDSDSATDVYARDLPGGPTLLVSAGGGADTPAAFAAIDASGEHAFFTTGESLVGGADTNGANDVYEWTEGGGSPSLITSGTCTQGAARSCGSFFDAAIGSSTVFFTTTESLVPADEDTERRRRRLRAGSRRRGTRMGQRRRCRMPAGMR